MPQPATAGITPTRVKARVAPAALIRHSRQAQRRAGIQRHTPPPEFRVGFPPTRFALRE